MEQGRARKRRHGWKAFRHRLRKTLGKSTDLVIIVVAIVVLFVILWFVLPAIGLLGG